MMDRYDKMCKDKRVQSMCKWEFGTKVVDSAGQEWLVIRQVVDADYVGLLCMKDGQEILFQYHSVSPRPTEGDVLGWLDMSKSAITDRLDIFVCKHTMKGIEFETWPELLLAFWFHEEHGKGWSDKEGWE